MLALAIAPSLRAKALPILIEEPRCVGVDVHSLVGSASSVHSWCIVPPNPLSASSLRAAVEEVATRFRRDGIARGAIWVLLEKCAQLPSMRENGFTYASVRKWAEMLRVSRRSVQQILRRAEKLKLLDVEQRSGETSLLRWGPVIRDALGLSPCAIVVDVCEVDVCEVCPPSPESDRFCEGTVRLCSYVSARGQIRRFVLGGRRAFRGRSVFRGGRQNFAPPPPL